MDYEEILKELRVNLLAIVKDDFLGFKNEGKKDMEAFLDASEVKLKRWTSLLAAGNLTVEDFEWLVKSQQDLLVMNALYQTGISKIKLGHFKNKAIKVIIKTIITAIL